MNDIYFKVIALFLIFLGEALAIIAELFSARFYNDSSKVFYIGFAIAFLAGIVLVLGYVFGFRFFKNIWIVSVISLVSIILIEPFLDYTIFKQLPKKGAFVGMVLGIVGLLSAVFIK